MSLASRQKKKLTQKTNWYKSKPKNLSSSKKQKSTTNQKKPKPMVSLIFVPKTVSKEHQSIAASYGAAMIVCGLALGSLISTPIVNSL